MRWAVALLVLFSLPRAEARGATRAVALTFDDLPGLLYRGDNCDVAGHRRMNEQLVSAIKRNRVPALGVVNEGKLCPEQRDALRSLLNIWADAGLDLGNHTYSHRDFNVQPLAAFEQDIVAGEKTVRSVVAAHGKTLRYFRFPMLHEGKELQKKRAIEQFLHERGYVNAVVSVDNDDYIYALAYSRADAAAKKRIADDYIRYMDSIFAFYEKFSHDTLGYEPPQIVLLHDHQLNADTLDRLVEMLRKRGYSFVSIDEALRDPVYRRAESYTGGRGISWIHRVALESKKPAPDQPEVPSWIMSAANLH